MAEPTNNPQGLEKPAGMQKPKDDLVIHVIPEKFYGAALKKKLPKVKAEPAAPVPLPAAVRPGAVSGTAPKKSRKLVIIIAAFAVLLAGSVAAYFFLAGEPVPQGPVCGNAVCEAGETTASCQQDCPAPLPVCGNAQCEAGESPQNCSIDCGPPPSVCGDALCQSDETAASCPVDCGPPPAVCGNVQCETGEDEASCPADCTPPEPVPGLDTDSDGLTDLEERSIYQTNPRLADTDGDQYVDLNEVLNLYDPNGKEPQMLLENPGITLHTDSALGYEVYRPTGWTVGAGPEGQTRFTAPTGERIDLLVEDLADGDTLMDWYLALDATATAESTRLQTTRRGYEHIISPNRTAIFLRAESQIFILSYDLNGSAVMQYRVTFEMMANSFRLTASQS